MFLWQNFHQYFANYRFLLVYITSRSYICVGANQKYYITLIVTEIDIVEYLHIRYVLGGKLNDLLMVRGEVTDRLAYYIVAIHGDNYDICFQRTQNVLYTILTSLWVVSIYCDQGYLSRRATNPC